MINKIEIRSSVPTDFPVIEEFYPMAFPEEDLIPLLKELIEDASIVQSFVAIVNGAVVGHVSFTECKVDGKTDNLSLLGPLAVAPVYQKQGVGSALVRFGLASLVKRGVSRVLVLGDPNYYGRFGFEIEKDVTPPYPLPEKWQSAWQSQDLIHIEQRLSGTLMVPKPWCERALWEV